MRPFRSFLVLLFFLVLLTWIFNLFGVKELFFHSQEPSIAVAPASFDQPKPETEPLSVSLFSSFLDSLEKSKGQVRILYYGDSQVEGDRITFYLRQLLRDGRGGTGPGLFQPLIPVMYTKTLWIKSSPNWKRYNYLSYRSGKISHNKLGPFMAICRFIPEGTYPETPQKATIRIRPSIYTDTASSEWEMLRIFYSLPEGNVRLTVKKNNDPLYSGILPVGPGVREMKYEVSGSKDLELEFEGKTSPDIYGISIEGNKGIIVDNIPQRGSAGLEFTMVDAGNLKENYALLSPDLVILHYGLNIVRNVRVDYDYYKKGVIRQVDALKEVVPSTPVLVIGVTDMAGTRGDTIESFSNIPAIIKAQKEAATETGAAFWDAYDAMGGNRSIVAWAERNPPLAENDFVHLTYPGADTLASMLDRAMFKTDTLPGETIMEEPEQIVGKDEASNALTVKKKIARIFAYHPEDPFIFSAPAFWLFLVIVLAGYSLIYKKLFLRNFYLLLVSLFFYFKTGGLFLFLLVFITVIDFTCGYLIFRSGRKYIKKLFILTSLISNLGILAYFKYTGFLVETINNLAGTHFETYDFLASFSNSLLGTNFNISSILLPAGISFFTFQSLSYTIDIYRGRLEPVKSIIDFGFYVSFFPQLVAGPIVRASEFIPQLYAQFSLTKREFSHALYLISKGLIKKIVISDFIALHFVDRVFDLPNMYSGFENLMAVYGYGLQIYCDFSGYTDIAIGIALIFGFRLPVNFNSPYKAASISDFWKRWHISLSRWLKDYLYISMGGNRKGKFRTGFNILITMLLGGLWHGAALKYIIWGGLHGIGLIMDKLLSYLTGNRLKPRRLWKILAVFVTFNFISFCWIFFRAADIKSAFLMINQIGSNFSPGSYLTVLPAYASVFSLMAAGYIIHFLPENLKEAYRGLFIRMPLILQFMVIGLVAVLLLQMRTTDVTPFIYFRF